MADTLPEQLRPGLAEFLKAAETGQTEQLLPYLKRYQTFVKDNESQKHLCYQVHEALTRAIQANRLETADLLLENGLPVRTSAVIKALSNAKANNSAEVFEILLKHGWDVNHNLGHSGDSLTLSANTQIVFLIDWLLDHGADPNSGLLGNVYSALECAAQTGNLASTKRLVQAGAQIETRSALPLAAANGHLDVVNYLLDAGAKIDEIPDNEEIYDNARAYGIKNALSAAADSGQAKVVELLLKRGADRHITDTLGRTPLELAQAKNYQDCVELLKE